MKEPSAPAARARWIALLVLTLASGGGGLRAQAGPAPPDAPLDTAPVELDGETLFRVRGVPTLPAEDRAEAVVERLALLAADPGFDPESLRIVESDLGSVIQGGTTRVVAITESDGEIEGLRRQELAEIARVRMQEAVRRYREDRSRAGLLAALGRAGVALAIFGAVLGLLIALGRRVGTNLRERFQRRVHGVAVASFEVIRAERIWGYFASLLRGAYWLVLLGLCFAWLVFTLRQFPWTRGAGKHLDDWLVGPVTAIARGIAESVPDLLFVLVLALVVRWFLKLVRLFFDAVSRGEVTLGGFAPEWATPTYKLLRIAIVAFAVVVAYPYIPGSESPAFKGISIFLGVVFSLGSSSATSNIVAGYAMTYRGVFKEGDVVRIGDATGVVSQVRLQVTHLRTPKNELVVIPNSRILESEVVNYSALARTEGLILPTTVGIGYETPWRQVEAMLLLAAARTPGLVAGRRPFVLQKALGDFAVTYELNVYIDDPARRLATLADLHRNILDVFNEHGVQIMTPAYEGDTEEPKVVPRERWFDAPAPPPALGVEAAEAEPVQRQKPA